MSEQTWSGPEDGPPPATLIPGAMPGRPLPPQFGPRPGTLSRKEIGRQITLLADRLVRRARNLGLTVTSGHVDPDSMAEVLTMMLHSEPPGRSRGATIISEALLDVGERESPDFWTTDLGCALAREIGWCGPEPTRSVAAAVLRVSRQAIGLMVQEGRLAATDAGVTRESLQDAALARWPRESDTE